MAVLTRCKRCGNTFPGYGAYCVRCKDEMTELEVRKQEREREESERLRRWEREAAEREEAEQERAERHEEKTKNQLAERLVELDSLAEERDLRRVNIHVPSESLSVQFDLLSKMPFHDEAIKLHSAVVGSFEILRKDERLVDLHKEYGLQLEREYTIGELRQATVRPVADKGLKLANYMLVKSGDDLNMVLRSSAELGANASTYEGKKVRLKDSPITVVLYVQKTAEEKKMLGRLLKAIDTWFNVSDEIRRREKEYSSAFEKGKKEIEDSATKTSPSVAIWIFAILACLLSLTFPVSAGVIFLIIVGVIVAAIILNVGLKKALRRTLQKDKKKNLEALQSTLTEQILMSPGADGQASVVEPGE